MKRVNKEGIISHYTLQYSFHLALHIRDKELLNYIQTMLNNIGTIYDIRTTQHAQLVRFTHHFLCRHTNKYGACM